MRMINKSVLVVAVLGALLASCSAVAPAVQESRYGPAAGESEASFAVSLSKSETDIDGVGTTDSTTLFAQVGGGYFLTDQQEVGGQILVSTVEVEGADDSNTLGLFPYYRWNFRVGPRSVVYVGAQVGVQSLDSAGDDDTSFGGGVHAGFKTWLTPRVAFFIEPRLNRTDYEINGTDIEITDLTTLLGLSILF